MKPNFVTLLDLAKKSGHDPVVGLIEEIGRSAPEVTAVSARTISGTSYKTWIRTGVPRVGFRAPNTPATHVVSKYEQRNIELFNISTMVHVDKAILSASEDGPAAIKAKESLGVAQGVVYSLGVQAFYGLAIDKDGFPGLMDFIDDSMIMSADSSKAPESEDGTSVYAIIEGPQGVQWVYGKGQSITLSPWRVRDRVVKNKDGSIGVIPGEGSDLDCWTAFVSNSKLAAARLKNIGDKEGTTLNDDMLADLLAKFPAGYRATKLIMNTKALNQLRKSRPVMAVSSNGGSVGGSSVSYSPIPTDHNGIPILVTDSILNNESDLSAITGITHWNLDARN